jgi:hypothetical protein
MTIQIKDLPTLEELTPQLTSQITGGFRGYRYNNLLWRVPFAYNYHFQYRGNQPTPPPTTPPKPAPEDCNIRCITTPCPCTISDDGTPIYR